jgi:hypothetical protein
MIDEKQGTDLSTLLIPIDDVVERISKKSGHSVTKNFLFNICSCLDLDVVSEDVYSRNLSVMERARLITSRTPPSDVDIKTVCSINLDDEAILNETVKRLFDDVKMEEDVSTQGHNAYRRVFIAMARKLLKTDGDIKADDLKNIVELGEFSSTMPTVKTLEKYLIEK